MEPAMVRFQLSPQLHAGKEEEEQEGEGCGPAPPPPPPLGTPTPHSSRGGAGGPREPFDAPRAAAALLGSSFAARCAVGGAAAGAMNVPPEQRLYQGLVSLAVPPPPGPRRGVPPPPTPSPTKVPGPEVGALAGEGAGRGGGEPWLPPPAPPEAPRPRPRPPAAAFLMYRKLQQWGGAGSCVGHAPPSHAQLRPRPLV